MATKTKLAGGAPLSKIPTIKRPVPVGLKAEPAPLKSKTQQITVPPTPKNKTTEPIKVNEVKVPPAPHVPQVPISNKENKENISLISTKKVPQESKVKGYTDLKKSEERLSELVNKLELEKQHYAQQIQTIEHRHKNELKAKDEVIRRLQSETETSNKIRRGAEDELSAVQDQLSASMERNKTLERMLERLGVDVVSLQSIPSTTNIEEIESQYQEFKHMCEEGYKISLEYVQQQDQLLSLLSCEDIVIPSVSSTPSSDLDATDSNLNSNIELPISDKNDEFSNSNSNFVSDSSFVAASEDMFDEEMEDVNDEDILDNEETNVNISQAVVVM